MINQEQLAHFGTNFMAFTYLASFSGELPQWSSGQDSAIPLQGAWVWVLLWELKQKWIPHAPWCCQKKKKEREIWIFKNKYFWELTVCLKIHYICSQGWTWCIWAPTSEWNTPSRSYCSPGGILGLCHPAFPVGPAPSALLNLFLSHFSRWTWNTVYIC